MSSFKQPIGPEMDLIAQAASQHYTPSTASTRLMSMIYRKFAQHRDALGYPVGCDGGPAFYMSNDLSMKFAMFLKLTGEAGVRLERDWLIELARAFVSSYDDDHGSGCCRLYHSLPKEAALGVLTTLEAAASR